MLFYLLVFSIHCVCCIGIGKYTVRYIRERIADGGLEKTERGQQNNVEKMKEMRKIRNVVLLIYLFIRKQNIHGDAIYSSSVCVSVEIVGAS